MKNEVQDRIVSITIPLVGGTKTYFSGYLIGDGIVITCRHGFITKQDYNNKEKIRILSQLIDQPIDFNARNIKELLDDGLLLFASKKYDIALFKCEGLSSHNYNYQRLHLAELDKKGDWNAGGYPYYNRDNKETKGYKNFSGTFEAVEKKATKLTLHVTTELPKMQHWQEVSGSPIFIDNKLAGIAKGYSNYQDENKKAQTIGKELKASYLKRLWDEDDADEAKFRKILEKVVPKSSTFRKKIIQLLKQEPNLKKALIEAFKNDDDEIFLDSLCALSKQEVMELCTHLLDDNLEGVHELLLYAMAVQYESNPCFDQQASDKKPYIDVPIIRVEACEFLMAAEDQRDPSFRKGLANKALPKKYSIITPPESGIESTTENDIMSQLLAGQGGSDELIERVFADYDREEGISYPDKKKTNIVNAMLKRDSGTYYWRLEVSNADMNNLKKVFSSLPIKILNVPEDPEGNIDWEEQDLFSSLGKFVKG